MRWTLHLGLALALTAACGGGGEEVPPDAGPDAGMCETATGGESFELLVSMDELADFRELLDGDEATVVRGPQGFWMIPLEVRASLAVDPDELCIGYVVTVSGAGEFAGVNAPGKVPLHRLEGDVFRGYVPVILGSALSIDASVLHGIDVHFSLSCAGHGFNSEVARDLHLVVVDG